MIKGPEDIYNQFILLVQTAVLDPNLYYSYAIKKHGVSSKILVAAFFVEEECLKDALGEYFLTESSVWRLNRLVQEFMDYEAYKCNHKKDYKVNRPEWLRFTYEREKIVAHEVKKEEKEREQLSEW